MGKFTHVLVILAAVAWLWLVPRLTRPDGARRTAAELGLRRGDVARGMGGMVVAVSDELSVAVLSVGQSDGVTVGDHYVIRRGASVCAEGVVEKVEQNWC